MARAVADLRRQTGTATRGDLEAMLVQYYTMGAGLPPPASLEYAAGELKLKGIDPEAAQRARIAAKLAGMGYKAQMDGDTLMVRQEQQP
jgi:general secretion pathway protein L